MMGGIRRGRKLRNSSRHLRKWCQTIISWPSLYPRSGTSLHRIDHPTLSRDSVFMCTVDLGLLSRFVLIADMGTPLLGTKAEPNLDAYSLRKRMCGTL